MWEAIKEVWDQSTRRRAHNRKGGIRNVSGGETVASPGLKTRQYMMHLKGDRWDSTGSEGDLGQP